jgi:hypothetical protein
VTAVGQRRARRNGDTAEAQVLTACHLYRVRGEAWICRTGQRPRFSPRDDIGTPVDFTGVLPGGRAVLAEVKSTAARRLGLRPHGSPVMPDPQRLALAWAHAEGALALVLIRTALGWWRLDWPGWVYATAAASSLGAKELDYYGRSCVLDDDAPLFLEGL